MCITLIVIAVVESRRWGGARLPAPHRQGRTGGGRTQWMPRPLRATVQHQVKARQQRRCIAALCAAAALTRERKRKRKENKRKKPGCCRRTELTVSLTQAGRHAPKTGDGCEGRPNARRHRHYFCSVRPRTANERQTRRRGDWEGRGPIFLGRVGIDSC